MSLKLITAPSLEPITLAEAQAHCRVDAGADDALLAIYIQAAREQAEGLLFSALISQTWEQTLDAFPADGDIKLLKPPVQSITSVTYIDSAGDLQTMANDAYVLDAATSPGWLLPADGTEWPATDDVINAVTIRFVAGFGATAADVPANIRAWLLLTIAQLYDQRAAADASGKVAALPGRFVDGLLDPWRQYGL